MADLILENAMLKKFITIAFCLILTACGTFNIRVEMVPAATATPAIQPSLHLPTPKAQILAPTATLASAPFFSPEIRFSEGKDKPEQRVFPPKTRQVYAIWSYSNMSEGMTVLREWYLNGQLWLSREEPWDFAKYGASGTVTNISIFDIDAGLPSGDYQLRLYIDGQPQFTPSQAAEQSAFTIQEVVQPILASIRMTDSLRGWGIDQVGRVLRTVNGGSSWQDRTPTLGTFTQRGFFAFNSEAAWAVPGKGNVWRTQDGGQTWKSGQPVDLPGDGNFQAFGVQFPDATNGWMVFLAQNPSFSPRMILFKTNDGGETWTRVNALEKPEMSSYLPDTKTGMVFFDGQNGWIGGWWWKDNPNNRWASLQTSNHGNSWDVIALPAVPNLLAGQPVACDGWAIGDMPPGAMAVEVTCTQRKHVYHRLYYLSTMTGPEWKSWDLPGAFIGADFIDNHIGWMMVTGQPGYLNVIYKTVDGGATWYKFNQASWKTAQFDFVSDQVGYAIVGNGTTSAFIHTVDGGKTWLEIKPVVENR
jgi:photosystem II stability/assembly factor-like uncharacterized protein